MIPTSKGVTIYRPPEGFEPQKIDFQLVRGGTTIAAAQLEQDAVAEGVRQVKVTGQLHGILFVPPGPGPFPVPLRKSNLISFRRRQNR
jgi:hypothetical protein